MLHSENVFHLELQLRKHVGSGLTRPLLNSILTSPRSTLLQMDSGKGPSSPVAENPTPKTVLVEDSVTSGNGPVSFGMTKNINCRSDTVIKVEAGNGPTISVNRQKVMNFMVGVNVKDGIVPVSSVLFCEVGVSPITRVSSVGGYTEGNGPVMPPAVFNCSETRPVNFCHNTSAGRQIAAGWISVCAMSISVIGPLTPPQVSPGSSGLHASAINCDVHSGFNTAFAFRVIKVCLISVMPCCSRVEICALTASSADINNRTDIVQ